ncbi:unnamed protein product [Ectocarpus sp. 12 AP-2014]
MLRAPTPRTLRALRHAAPKPVSSDVGRVLPVSSWVGGVRQQQQQQRGHSSQIISGGNSSSSSCPLVAAAVAAAAAAAAAAGVGDSREHRVSSARGRRRHSFVDVGHAVPRGSPNLPGRRPAVASRR